MSEQLNNFFAVLLMLPYQDIVILLVNLVLLIAAPRILDYFYHDEVDKNKLQIRVRIFRSINVLLFVLYAYHYGQSDANQQDWQMAGWEIKVMTILIVLYFAYLVNHVVYYFIQQRFGKEREVNGDKKIIETYNARLLGILSTAFIFVISLISVIQILGFDSWLEAGGVIGFVGVFLALTQNSWAPDIFSGLIILNSGSLEEGDVIEINGSEKLMGIVFKTKMFHTEILNLVNNHRIMIRNALLRDCVVHNLSRFASAKGLREQLHFNVAYEISGSVMRGLVDEVFERLEKTSTINIEQQHGYELGPLNADDYSVEWVLYYYVKDIKNILQIRLMMRELVLDIAKEQGIDIATPMLNHLVVNSESEKSI